ncbi:FtsX-like permease family protein [Telmatobacter bradus]|uniref:FtsX-like permease family protein n=1 Tax=Telmatobacter bradus TaxID=474953 RepID=UPI003B43A918
MHTNTGLQAERVLTFSISLPRAKYATEASRAAFFRDLQERLRNAPGVEAVGAVDRLPMDDGFTGGTFAVEGRADKLDREASMVEYSTTTPGYFGTMGIRVLAGRDFTAQDAAGSIPVSVIDETLARKFFSHQDPIGHRYKDDYDGQWRTIVGVVAAVRRKLPTEEPEPVVYSPYAQKQQRNMSIALRTRGAAAGMTNTVRATVAAMDADLPVQDVRTMRAVVSDAMLVERMLMQFMMGFAAFALLIVGIGVYGVVDYAVRQRRREMGIRLALGASRAAVQRQALRCGVLPAVAGLAVGVPLAIAASSLLRALLYGTGPQDVLFFALVGAVLLGLALLAGWLPARRAARMDAMTALRCE